MDLNNKIILITGASSGIGEASASLFAKHGAKLILCARRKDKLEKLAVNLKKNYNTESLILTLDVQNRTEVESVLGNIPSSFAAIDVLINNAGLALATDPIQAGLMDNWDRMIDTNLKGLLYVTRTLLPGMIARQQGHIINISSIAGYECYTNGNVYCATKHAVKALSKSMRLDLLNTPVKVSDIAPGAVETEFSIVRWNDKEKAKQFYSDFTPLVAADIADAVLYCITRPEHVNVAEMLILPADQAAATQINRK
ncbi:MAG: SDR family NAD(P)-dependent oxidoreductase [Proteobacteria bacterium]|nr:SDR family NAD(P)-dependent oxidoreductase [Pseudomonadota bacterium]